MVQIVRFIYGKVTSGFRKSSVFVLYRFGKVLEGSQWATSEPQLLRVPHGPSGSAYAYMVLFINPTRPTRQTQGNP
jgi:hypothetical protein